MRGIPTDMREPQVRDDSWSCLKSEMTLGYLILTKGASSQR